VKDFTPPKHPHTAQPKHPSRSLLNRGLRQPNAHDAIQTKHHSTHAPHKNKMDWTRFDHHGIGLVSKGLQLCVRGEWRRTVCRNHCGVERRGSANGVFASRIRLRAGNRLSVAVLLSLQRQMNPLAASRCAAHSNAISPHAKAPLHRPRHFGHSGCTCGL
jgi:hypothetical protein